MEHRLYKRGEYFGNERGVDLEKPDRYLDSVTDREIEKSFSRLLIVDDSLTTRNLIKKVLNPCNFKIVEAEDGIQGLNLARAHEFDLIVTDIDMPRLNGIDFCRYLKDDPATRRTPVVILSALETDEAVNKGFQVGASAFIRKECLRTEFKDRVNSILEKFRFQRERLIIVVDDSSIIRQLVEKGLTKAGYQVLTAENGEVALQLAETAIPDLILSDIDMPVMDGFTLCEKIHSDERLKSIPFVAMSVNSDRAYMQRMLHCGAESYLVKPFNIDQLTILVSKLISDQFLLLLKEKERLDGEREMMIASIASLVQALEARDTYTRGHSEGVASIIAGMASHMRFDREETEDIITGAKLHDIGKIGIRDSVLLKPGKLTTEEYQQIKRHPDIGADILKSIPSFSQVVSIVLSHHERFDGKGYPHGIGAKEIPLWARMTAVADTYDALTTVRPYRKAISLSQAIEIMREVRGTQLCPECVDIFLDWTFTVVSNDKN